MLMIMWVLLLTLFLCFLWETNQAELPISQPPKGGSESFNSSLYSRYFDLSELYFGSDAGRASECLQFSRRHGWKFGKNETIIARSNNGGSSNFFTVGFEGAGHHLIVELHQIAIGKKSNKGTMVEGGGVFSFSANGNSRAPQKKPYAWRLYQEATGLNPDLTGIQGKRFLVLIRDPVDSFLSALRRFWRQYDSAVDTLQREWQQLQQSMLVMQRSLHELPCESTLYLSYEMLLHYPREHQAVLAHFFQLSADDPNLIQALLEVEVDSTGDSKHSLTQRDFLPAAYKRDLLLQRAEAAKEAISVVDSADSFAVASIQQQQQQQQRHSSIAVDTAAAASVHIDRPFIVDCRGSRTRSLRGKLRLYDWPLGWRKNCSATTTATTTTTTTTTTTHSTTIAVPSTSTNSTSTTAATFTRSLSTKAAADVAIEDEGFIRCFELFRERAQSEIYNKRSEFNSVMPQAPMSRCSSSSN